MKKSMNIFHRNIAFLSLLGLCLIAFAGCIGSASQTQPEATGTIATKLPKLNLHLPDDGGEALERMKELVAALSAEGELPEPMVYTVREVIHGSGPSAHSHYNRVVENEKSPNFDHDDHEEHMESEEKLHEVSVDALEELRDLAYGLPKIAAKGNIDEASWKTVKETSKAITDFLGRHNDKTPMPEKRKQIRAQAKQFDTWFAKLGDCLTEESKAESAESK